MNQSYFENRIDRYILFKNSANLAEYLICLTENLKQLYVEQDRMQCDQTRRDCPKFTDLNLKSNDFDLNDPKYIYIYPCVQMGKHGVNQDLQFARKIFSNLPLIMDMTSSPIICTSYLNLMNWFRKFILKTRTNWKILTSSAQSNSFYNSKGLSSYIPKLYQYNLHSLFRDSANFNNNIQAYEFNSKDMTFHAKGEFHFYQIYILKLLGFLIWTKDTGTLSTIGSPNFGSRSEKRDNELQFYVFSKNLSFNNQIDKVSTFFTRNAFIYVFRHLLICFQMHIT